MHVDLFVRIKYTSVRTAISEINCASRGKIKNNFVYLVRKNNSTPFNLKHIFVLD